MECDRDKTDDYWAGDRDKTDDYWAYDLNRSGDCYNSLRHSPNFNGFILTTTNYNLTI
jgi:hypothetical protein